MMLVQQIRSFVSECKVEAEQCIIATDGADYRVASEGEPAGRDQGCAYGLRSQTSKSAAMMSKSACSPQYSAGRDKAGPGKGRLEEVEPEQTQLLRLIDEGSSGCGVVVVVPELTLLFELPGSGTMLAIAMLAALTIPYPLIR